MLTTIHSASQYILFLIALAGEVEQERLLDNSSMRRDYMLKTIREMIRSHLIRRFTYKEASDRIPVTVLRLCEPAGTGAVRNISPELALHYDLMVGPAGSRHKGDQSHKERRRRSYMLAQLFYESGIQVDMLRHLYEPILFGKTKASNQKEFFSQVPIQWKKSVFDGDGKILKPENILTVLGDDTCYITTRAMTRMNELRGSSRSVMFRAFGFLVRGQSIYPVYYLASSGEMWWKDVERQLLALVERYKSEIYKIPITGKGSAIFYVPSLDTFHTMVHPVKKTRSRINPPEVYSSSYILPLEENHEQIRTMLLVNAWKEKCNHILLHENAKQDEPYDGIMRNYEVYNLLGNDMSKMMAIRTRVSQRPSLFIIHEWQKKIVDDLYGKDAQVIIFSKAEFADLVEEIKEKE